MPPPLGLERPLLKLFWLYTSILVSVSTPIVKQIYFLQADLSVSVASVSIDGKVKLGVFGYCVEGIGTSAACQGPQLGYELDSDQVFGNSTRFSLPNSLIKWLTYALIIHPIAAGLAAVAFISGVASHFRELSRSRFTTCIASTAATVAMLAFVFDIVLFSIAKSRINSASNSDVGLNASLGNGVWLTLVGFILLALSGCFFGFGHCCINRRPKQAEKDSMRPQMDQVMAADSRRTATALASGHNSNLPAFPEEEQMPLTAHPDETANQSVESVNEQDVAGVGTGYGRGPGSTDPHRSLPPIPRRQGSQVSEYSPHRQPSNDANNGYLPSRERTPSQSGYSRRQNSDYNAPYVANMYSVQRPYPAATAAATAAPLAFPTPQSVGGPARSPVYPPTAPGPMTAPLAAPMPWVPPLREGTSSPYRQQSTPFQPRHQQSTSMPYGHQQSASVSAVDYAGHQQQDEPAFGARQYTHSPQPWLPPVDTGSPVTLDQTQPSFSASAAAATRHRHSQSDSMHYAPQPFASRQNALPSQQYQQGPAAALSPPMEVYESYYNESPTAIPYMREGGPGPSPSYHTSDAQAYPSYGGNVLR